MACTIFGIQARSFFSAWLGPHLSHDTQGFQACHIIPCVCVWFCVRVRMPPHSVFVILWICVCVCARVADRVSVGVGGERLCVCVCVCVYVGWWGRVPRRTQLWKWTLHATDRTTKTLTEFVILPAPQICASIENYRLAYAKEHILWMLQLGIKKRQIYKGGLIAYCLIETSIFSAEGC